MEIEDVVVGDDGKSPNLQSQLHFVIPFLCGGARIGPGSICHLAALCQANTLIAVQVQGKLNRLRDFLTAVQYETCFIHYAHDTVARNSYAGKDDAPRGYKLFHSVVPGPLRLAVRRTRNENKKVRAVLVCNPLPLSTATYKPAATPLATRVVRTEVALCPLSSY